MAKKPTRPFGGAGRAAVALSATAGAVFTTPKQLCPRTRMPLPRARATSSCSAAAPSGPFSANPADSTTSPCTPLRAHSSTTEGTASGGVATTARSTPPGTSESRG